MTYSLAYRTARKLETVANDPLARGRNVIHRKKLRGASLAAALLIHGVGLCQVPSQIQRMVDKERIARGEAARFSYEAEERSDRTDGKLWHEFVVETDDGPLRQLIAVDGKPLSAQQGAQEKTRLRSLAAHPGSLHKLRAAMESDEARLLGLLAALPKAFLFTPEGEADGCERFRFSPNLAFQPSTMEERIMPALLGTVSVKLPDDRLCRLDATVDKPVEFGFGLLGHLDQGGKVLLERSPVRDGYWKSSRIDVHVKGKILLFKNLDKNQTVNRTHIQLLQKHLTVEQSLALLK